MAKAVKDALDTLAEEAAFDATKVIALMLWKDRHRNPEMAVQITEADITSFKACTDYLEVTPEVRIVRPQGRPAQEAVPAQGKRRAVSARAAEPARPFVAVNVVAKGTTNSIKPIENSEENAQRRDEADRLRRVRDQALGLANSLLADLAQNQTSNSTIREAAQALQTLARA